MRALLLGLGVLSLVAVVSVDEADGSDCRPRDECCKVCSAGKACGNSCISRDKQCHQPPGCACDSEDVCQ